MKKSGENTRSRQKAKEITGKKDPTIRQEFPGAGDQQKKIEEGMREVKKNTPATKGTPIDKTGTINQSI